MHNLALFGGLRSSQEFVLDLTPIAVAWRRTTRAVGGYWLGSFQLGQQNLSQQELQAAYLTWIGATIREYGPGGVTTWEGVVNELRFVTQGREYMTSLRPEWWRNNVKVIYRSIADGSRQTVAWSENTEASNYFGEMQRLLVLGSATAAAATAIQGADLADFAWPRSRPVNSFAFKSLAREVPDQLLVKCAGLWHTMNWLYQETSLTDTAANIVTTLVGNTEFVTAGKIEANTLSTYVEASPTSIRIGAALAGITAQGDAAQNTWKCGVYQEQELIYEPAPTEVRYYTRGPDLLDQAGGHVLAPLIQPGFLLHDSAAPVSIQRPGNGDARNDPHISYIDEVEFLAPDGLRLRLYSEPEAATVLLEQIKAGTALQRRYG